LLDGVIDACHSRADYDAARREGVVSSYGDFGEANDIALENPALVGTAAKPCPEPAPPSSESGIGGALLVVIPVGLSAIALAVLYRVRRRGGGEGDEHDGPAA
jgi:hypothetical protein